MRIDMNYGKKGLTIELPEEWDSTVIRKKQMPVLDDPSASMLEALENPIGSEKLGIEMKGCKNACILICDITRPVPNGIILPQLIRTLMDGGMSPENITVLVATGLHRPNEGEELAELVGDPWVLDTVTVANHFARNDEDHIPMGVTSGGIKVFLDKRFVGADLRIVTGLVEPHFMAGYSGGRKVIMPGVAHKETITSTHTASFFEHPKSANCIMEGNPFHEIQLEVARSVGHVLAVNTVIDEFRNVSFINFGHIEESHYEAVNYVRDYTEAPMNEKFPTVITSSAGYPLDKTYYQTVKGMVGPMDILEQGGDLFIASECSEGMGSAEYVDAQKRFIELGLDGFMNELFPKSHALIDEWQTEMQIKPMRIGQIHLYTDKLDKSDWKYTGVHVYDSFEQWEDRIRESLASRNPKRVAVIPEGPYIVPLYKGMEAHEG